MQQNFLLTSHNPHANPFHQPTRQVAQHHHHHHSHLAAAAAAAAAASLNYQHRFG